MTFFFFVCLCSVGHREARVSYEEGNDQARPSMHTQPSNKAQMLAMPQFGLRDNLIRCELLKNEDVYTYLENFRWGYILSALSINQVWFFIMIWIIHHHHQP